MLERRMDDYWNIEGNRDLSDSRTGFTRFTTLDEKPYLARWAFDEEANDIQARLLVFRDMERHVRSSATKRKTEEAIEKPMLHDAWRLPGVYFIDPADAELKETLKHALSKFEVPMPAAMPCKIRRRKFKETCRTPDARKTKYACIVESDESTRRRLEGTLHEDHEDHIAWKGDKSLQHYNLVHNFILMPQAMKIPDAEAAVDKDWKKLETIPGLAAGRIRPNWKP